MMADVWKLTIVLYICTCVEGQVQQLMAQMMAMTENQNNNSLNTGNTSNCSTKYVSCLPAPWCKRTKDVDGCPKCNCDRFRNLGSDSKRSNSTGSSDNRGFGNMQGSPMNPFASMFGSGGSFGFPGFPNSHGQSGPINPMAAMFGGSSMMGGGFGGTGGGFGGTGGGSMGGMMGPMGMSMGGMNPMGGMMSQQIPTADPNCDPAPYTCPAPPPWCQRVVDEQGCVKCYCGQELEKYFGRIQGKDQSTTEDPICNSTSTTTINTTMSSNDITMTPTTSTTTMTSLLTTTEVSTMAPPLGKPCLANFVCTADCTYGYQTDSAGCPLCACNGNSSTPTQNTKTTIQPIVNTDNALINGGLSGTPIVCPGIFDCMKMCMNGYKVDGQGCPLCNCVPDS